MAKLPPLVNLRGWARIDDDPVRQEIYRALAYLENHHRPGEIIEMSCQRCPEVYYGTSPRQLASLIYEHMKSTHPEAWLEPIDQ
jgi:hypothetical protein